MKFDSSIAQTRWESPLGTVIVAATERGLAGLWFEGQRHLPDHCDWRRDDDHPVLRQAVAQLAQYFSGERTVFDLPLDLQGGTAFQQSVWRALLAIPRGRTTSYSVLSQRIGLPGAARAVGAAVGRNPISFVVPCHRVLGKGGGLCGYHWGLTRKRAILGWEAGVAGRPAG